MNLNNKVELSIGIPDEVWLGPQAAGLLKRAEIPVARGLVQPVEQTIWFDMFTQAVRKPTKEQQVGRLRIVTMKNAEIRELVGAGALDLGITTGTNRSLAEPGASLPVELPEGSRFTTLSAELLLKEPVVAEFLINNSLKGVKGFRQRLILSIVRASRDIASEAADAVVQLERAKQEPNYWDWAEGRGFWRY